MGMCLQVLQCGHETDMYISERITAILDALPFGFKESSKVRRLRAMGSLCRQQAAYNPDQIGWRTSTPCSRAFRKNEDLVSDRWTDIFRDLGPGGVPPEELDRMIEISDFK